MTIHSPKFSGSARAFSPNYYYAGFTEKFVESVLDRIGVGEGDVVLDCWNGSGTTTTVCSRRGIESVGFDINPLMSHLSSVRAMGSSRRMNNLDFFNKVIQNLNIDYCVRRPYEHAATFHREIANYDGGIDKNKLHEMVHLLSSVVFDHYRHTSRRNPTWFSDKDVEIELTSSLDFIDRLTDRVRLEREFIGKNGNTEPARKPSIYTGDWLKANLRGRVFDHVISSPPYLTRIDYLRSMLPQLKYIEIVKDLNINQLRHQVMGTVLTRSSSSDRTLIKSTPAGIVEVLNRIRAHPSKASGTYYSRFYLRYFLDLDRSIRKISRALKPQGTLTLVSQGSWYKDIFVDLPSMIISVAECYGLQLEWSSVFRPGGHMAFINRRSHASTQAAPPEVVAIFRKQKVDR